MEHLAQHAPVGTQLIRVAKAHRLWVAGALEHLGLHVGQELLLAQLCQEEGVRQGALAHALGVEPPTVHKMLSRLEAAGFVERRPDPTDSRASLTFLTARGRRTCEQIEAIWRDAEHRLISDLDVGEVTQIEVLLGRLARDADT